MSVYLYNKVDTKQILFSNNLYKKVREFNDEKKTIHYIDINYLERPLYIQLSRNSLNDINIKKRMIKINVNNQMKTFIRNLEDHIIKSVYKRSPLWFNGKNFTMNKISKCIVSNVSNNTGRKKDELILTISSDTKIYDQSKNKISLELLEQEFSKTSSFIDIICIIKLANLQFIDNRFSYNLVLQQAKIFKEDNISEYSIMDDEDSNDTIITELEDEYYSEFKNDSFDQNFF
jgi:hypothetical protein